MARPGGQSPPSPSSHPNTGGQQHDTDNAREDAVLIVHASHARLMSWEEAWQLIGRHQEIDGGNDEQDDAEQGGDELHGWILLKSTRNRREMRNQRTPVPPQRWHFTTLSPFLSRPLPSQFLHFCFFLILGPFSLAMTSSKP